MFFSRVWQVQGRTLVPTVTLSISTLSISRASSSPPPPAPAQLELPSRSQTTGAFSVTRPQTHLSYRMSWMQLLIKIQELCFWAMKDTSYFQLHLRFTLIKNGLSPKPHPTVESRKQRQQGKKRAAFAEEAGQKCGSHTDGIEASLVISIQQQGFYEAH